MQSLEARQRGFWQADGHKTTTKQVYPAAWACLPPPLPQNPNTQGPAARLAPLRTSSSLLCTAHRYCAVNQLIAGRDAWRICIYQSSYVESSSRRLLLFSDRPCTDSSSPLHAARVVANLGDIFFVADMHISESWVEPFLCKKGNGQRTSEQTALCLPRASPKHGLTAVFQVNGIHNNAIIRSQNHMMISNSCEARILNWYCETPP